MPNTIALACTAAVNMAVLPWTAAFQTPPAGDGSEDVIDVAPDNVPVSRRPSSARPVVTVIDIAHASQFSLNMMTRSPIEAAEWFVNEHLLKAAEMGVTLVIMKHPYRWRPEPFEDYRFGGAVPARRTALHAAIASARSRHLALPRLCAYQALPGGDSLAPSDLAILNSQREAFDEDAWEAIGCQPWQQAMIDQRRTTRPQHLEPVWDYAYPAQWTYGIDVTELFLSSGLSQYQFFPFPRPEVRCWFYRPLVPQFGETPRDTYIRTVRQFHAYCFTKKYTPVDPLDIYTELGATPDELHLVRCAGDYNGDGFVNGDDFDAFTLDFENGARYCDFNGDGFVSGVDFDTFMMHWIGGC